MDEKGEKWRSRSPVTSNPVPCVKFLVIVMVIGEDRKDPERKFDTNVTVTDSRVGVQGYGYASNHHASNSAILPATPDEYSVRFAPLSFVFGVCAGGSMLVNRVRRRCPSTNLTTKECVLKRKKRRSRLLLAQALYT